ncbi:MAG: AhpC/TSA family protein [Tannerellaceae bacterium]|jgi:peroxiredoxin|nr:AhpC/TSA family protein [Tannerellaceae bacterium]
MKKSVLYLFLALAIGMTGCGKDPHTLNLSGTVKNISKGKIYLQRYENKSFFFIDSTDIVDGRFSFTSKTKLPEIYGLTIDGSGENPFHSYILFLDNNPITVELDTIHEFKNTTVKGSKEHDLYLELLKNLRKSTISDILKEHPSSLAALYIFYRYYSYRLSPEEIKAGIELLDPSFQQTEYVETLTELSNTLELVSVGKPAPDFAATDIEGKQVKLSDYLGRGYVLIDFWASWCAPCRKENPHLVKLYEEYKDKGFEIIGVSLDNQQAPWLKAINDDRLPWLQLIDRNAWAGEGVKKYGVRLISANFLIDKEGVIVGRNLKGDVLKRTLEELLTL